MEVGSEGSEGSQRGERGERGGRGGPCVAPEAGEEVKGYSKTFSFKK